MSAEGIKQMQCQVHKSLSAGKNKLLQLFSHIIHAEIPKNDRFFFFHVQLKHFEKRWAKKKIDDQTILCGCLLRRIVVLSL